MKRVLAIILSIVTVLSVCSFSFSVSAKEAEADELYASTIAFDNSDMTKFASEDATLEYVKTTHPGGDTTGDTVGEHREWYEYYAKITGTGCYSFTVDASHLDFSEHNVLGVVFDSECDMSKFSVEPILQNDTVGSAAEYVSYKTSGYFKLESATDVKGIKVTALEAGLTLTLTELFLCENIYSAEFMMDNNVLPTTATPKRLIIHEESSQTAISLGSVKEEDKDVSKGGIYFDFTNCKWPSIVVDENDKLYIIASGCREGHHDGFSATVMTTSEDGGLTYSTPKQISNTICDDRDTGLVYMGEGRFLASYLTHGLNHHLTGGDFYDIITKPNAKDYQADKWIGGVFPSGGINGTYWDLINHVYETDYENSCYSDSSYLIMSDDYCETWNTVPYTLKEDETHKVTEAMADKAYKYQYNYAGVQAPIMSPHGPRQLLDGTLLWVGEAVDTTYVGWREKAVYASNDGGYTWDFKCALPIPCDFHNGDFPEPDITVTNDGVVVCALRSFTIFTCMSYDNGATWTTPNNARNTADEEPLLGVSHGISTMANGDLVLTTARRNYYEGGICYIYAYVSEDGGRTWSELAQFSKNLPASDFGYPGNAQLSDGTIVTCYYFGSDISTINWTYELVDAKANTWVKTQDGWRYYDENVKPVTKKWVSDGKGLCYLDGDGYLVTGRSIRERAGYILVDNNGHKVTKTGWQKVSSGWYYVQKNGYVKANCWMNDSKGWCFLSSSGLMQTNRPVKDTKGYCLVDASGYWVTKAGWHKAGNDWYYVQKGGYLKTNGWMKDSKGWCYLSSDGMMQKNTTLKDSKGWCLVDGSGYWVTSVGWHKVGTAWYYVQKGGYLKTSGWMKDSKGWCYLDSNGLMLQGTAVKDSKGWCILSDDGYWQQKAGEYYVRSSMNSELTAGYYTVGSDGYIVLK